jgi:hypothetical protein
MEKLNSILVTEDFQFVSAELIISFQFGWPKSNKMNQTSQEYELTAILGET